MNLPPTPLLSNAASYTNDALFQARVRVANQESGELNRVLPSAFTQVLSRLTANPAITQEPWAQQAIGKARNYLNQFKYEHLASAGSENQTEKTYLICEFNPSAVTKLLEQNSVAYWGSTRPAVVAWVLHEAGGERQIVDSNNISLTGLAGPLTRAAQQTGLDLVLPLMDLQEQGQISTGDLLVKDTNLLAKATERYNSKVFIVGQIRTLADNRWSAEWLLSIDGTQYRWPAEQRSDLLQLLRQGMTPISSELFQLYSHQPLSTHASNEIIVTNITDLPGYQRTWNYLAQLEGVISVVPLSFAHGQAGFTVLHSSDWSELNRLIGLGNTLLAPNVTPSALAAMGATVGTVGGNRSGISSTSIPSTIRPAVPRYRLNN